MVAMQLYDTVFLKQGKLVVKTKPKPPCNDIQVKLGVRRFIQAHSGKALVRYTPST